jgi:hypothetical protein
MDVNSWVLCINYVCVKAICFCRGSSSFSVS